MEAVKLRFDHAETSHPTMGFRGTWLITLMMLVANILSSLAAPSLLLCVVVFPLGVSAGWQALRTVLRKDAQA